MCCWKGQATFCHKGVQDRFPSVAEKTQTLNEKAKKLGTQGLVGYKLVGLIRAHLAMVKWRRWVGAVILLAEYWIGFFHLCDKN